MSYFVYILKSEVDQRFYFGQSQNLGKRIDGHNSGKSIYTKKYIPWKLVAYKTFESRKEAIKFERMLKNLHGQQKVQSFISRHNFILSNS